MNPLNSHTQRAIKRGKLVAEAELDLHGLRLHEAEEAVIGFMQKAIKAGYRAVRIITGKGQVLRDALPRWLEHHPQIHPHILSLQHARPQEGGSGAFLVLLRRVKEQGN
jgi:DNA-nicking Smr family endonuclease